jgi:hypothetical protein
VANPTGWNFPGTLKVGSNSVLLLDADVAELGALTTLAAGGRLDSFAGARLGPDGSADPTKALTAAGNAVVDGAFTNNGLVNGPTDPGQWLTFEDDVDGLGTFVGNIRFKGNYTVGMGATPFAAATCFEGSTVLVGEGCSLDVGGPTTFERTVTKTGAGCLTVTGPQTHGAGAALAVSGGTVNLNSDAGTSSIFNLTLSASSASTANLGATQHLAALDLAGGAKANLIAGHDKVLVTKALGIEEVGGVPTSRLDLADNAMVIDYDDPAASPLQDITRWIASGCDGRLWDGNGIVSTSAAGNPLVFGLGYAQNDLLFAKDQYSTFAGEPVDLTSVLVKYTYLGDVNLDGKVDDNDVTIMVLGYDRGLVSTHTWQQGDISGYDGKIDDNDITVLVLNYGAGWKPGRGGPLGEMSGAVPEPATLSLLALGGLALLRPGRRI